MWTKELNIYIYFQIKDPSILKFYYKIKNFYYVILKYSVGYCRINVTNLHTFYARFLCFSLNLCTYNTAIQGLIDGAACLFPSCNNSFLKKYLSIFFKLKCSQVEIRTFSLELGSWVHMKHRWKTIFFQQSSKLNYSLSKEHSSRNKIPYCLNQQPHII